MKTVRKTLAVLEAVVVAARRGVTLKDIAAQQRLPMATTLRVLRILEEFGYVTRDSAKQYQAGLRLWELGCAVVNRQDIVTVVRPALERLARETGETVSLAKYDRGEIVYLDKVNSPGPITMVLNIGERAPAYCVGTGKAILAWRPEPELAELLRRRLQRFTTNTLTSEDALRKELHRIRVQGYAMNRGEYRPDVHGVAIPLTDYDGVVTLALGAAGPAGRMKVERMAMIADRLKTVAGEMLHAFRAPLTRVQADAPHATGHRVRSRTKACRSRR
jgi:DNA-binding IclR family transcriptional regulator